MNWEDLKIRGLNELDLCSISMFLNVVSPSGLPIMVAFMLSEFVHGSLGFQSPYAIKDSYAEAVTPLFIIYPWTSCSIILSFFIFYKQVTQARICSRDTE